MELTIFQMVGPAVSVIKYVEGGGLEHDLASIEAEAAKDAFEKSRKAKKKKAQIWLVISHLETVETALKLLVESQAKRNLTPFPWMANVSELFNIRIFMASCYIYLKEYKLGLIMLDRAEDCLELLNTFNTGVEIMALASLPYYGWRDGILQKPLKHLGVDSTMEKIYSEEDIQSKLKPTIQNLRKVIYKKKKKFSPLEVK